jgi:uroporphyrin-III C-methyltransferase
MSDTDADLLLPAPRRRGVVWWLLGAVLLIAAALAWKLWPAGDTVTADAPVDLSPEALDARLLQTESAITSVRRLQESTNQRLTDTSARTGLLRDEVLGISQRAALVEESVRDLSSSRNEGVAALRMDEAELLLTMASERLQLANDVTGAIRATELADGVLSALRDPALLNLRQTLAQELAALRAMPKDPRSVAAGELDALEAVLPRISSAGPARSADAPPPARGTGLSRLLDALVQVRPSGEQDLLSPADRSAGQAALSLEIALARTALDRDDQAAFRASLVRMDSWLRRLYADGPLLRERRERLKKLGNLPLAIDLPVAGSTLAQLRTLQRNRPAAP